MTREESHRNRWALGLAATLSVFIFVGFAFYRGYLSFNVGGPTAGQTRDQVAAVVSAETAPSPVQNTKETFKAAFREIDKQYQEFKDSLSDVFVPFITGIEVYERK